MLTFGSLFAGIGGFDLGFERAGMRCEWQVEIDPYCQRVLAKHWPNVRRWDDVRTFPPMCEDEYAPNQWRVDVICGGDPCQANSIASGPLGSRAASLGSDFIRVVDALRPRIVVRENPISRGDAPWPWQRFRREFESIGYACLPFRLRGCCLGSDCERERVFVLAELVRPNRDGLEGRYGSGAGGWREPEHIPTPVHQADRIPVPRPRGYGNRAGIPGGVDRIRAIGNSVVPQVAEWIGRRIVECAG